jgi:hypothetical protein
MWGFVIAFLVICYIWSKLAFPSRRKKRAARPKSEEPLVTFEIQSFTDDDVAYDVDPSKLICSCPDWTGRRNAFKQDDPRRLCKHLVKAICETSIPECLAPYGQGIRFFHSKGWGFPVKEKRKFAEVKGRTVEAHIPTDGENEWAEVFDRGRMFGLHIYNYWWSRGEEPEDAEEIAQALVGKPAPLPADAITTTGRQPSPRHPGWIALGSVEGIELEADINPRAKWMHFFQGKEKLGMYEVKADDMRLPPYLGHLDKALRTWLLAEYRVCRAAWEESRGKTSAK